MNRIYGEAIETPKDTLPWAAVIYHGSGELTRAGAASKEEAEQLIVYLLQKLAAVAKKGFPPEDE